MEEFTLLGNEDINNAKDYLNKRPIINSFMINNIEKYGIKNIEYQKRSGDYYGYFVNNILKGVFFFNNMGVLNFCYDDKRILNKIILLKTIKKHKPNYIFGPTELVAPLYKCMEKTTKCYKYDDCMYMTLGKEDFKPWISQDLIINAKDFDFSKSINFLIEVEKSFGRNPHAINELKNKIYDRTKEEEYMYLLEKDEIKAQAFIQTVTSLVNEIGGVYTTNKSRGKGFAKAIVSKLCDRIIQRNKIPTLIVSKTNTEALKVYNTIGFKPYHDYTIIEIKVI